MAAARPPTTSPSASGARIAPAIVPPPGCEAFEEIADLFLTPVDECVDPFDALLQPALDPPAPIADPIGHGDAQPLASLGETAADPATSSAVGPDSADEAPAVTALLPVHLPVAAGPWLDQAAAALAQAPRDAGPVALIRGRDSAVTLDLFPHRLTNLDLGEALATPPRSLREARRRLVTLFPQWIVQIQSVTDLAAMPDLRVERLVLVTGADQAAVVATYQRLKQWRLSVASEAARTPRLGLIVMGSNPVVATAAARRVGEACRDFLGCEPELLAVVPRMQPVLMRRFGRFAIESDESPVRWINRDLRAKTGDGVISKVMANSDGRPASHETMRVAAPRLDTTLGTKDVGMTELPAAWSCECSSSAAMADPTQTHLSALPIARLRPAAVDLGSTVTSAYIPALPGQPSVSCENGRHPLTAAFPLGGSLDGELSGVNHSETNTAERGNARASLAEHVPGLVSLAARCPKATDVELAIDADGRLHALTLDVGDASLERLHVACDWAREHRDLFATCFGVARPGDAPIAHLFTDRPKTRRRLADGALRLHILAKAPAGGALVHLELN